MDIHSRLQEWLAGAERLAVIGAGSTLRADDAAGMEVVTRLAAEYSGGAHPELLFCPGETAPENFSGQIRAFRPTHMLLIDAADVGAAPGEIVEIPPEKVGGPTFLSHMLPLKVLINYLSDGTGARTLLLGVQWQSMDFDGPMTSPVAAAVDELCAALRRAIEKGIGR